MWAALLWPGRGLGVAVDGYGSGHRGWVSGEGYADVLAQRAVGGETGAGSERQAKVLGGRGKGATRYTMGLHHIVSPPAGAV